MVSYLMITLMFASVDLQKMLMKVSLIVCVLLEFGGLLATGWTRLNSWNIQSDIRDDRCKQFRTFTQRVDHFGFDNMDTYQQRYILNTEYWKEGQPIFFYAGNEGDIDHFCDNTGFMWDIAPKFQAMLIFAEHRFYGQSLPYGNQSYTNPEYTKYLTSEQALADYAYLIQTIRNTTSGAEQSPAIVFGGSYGGMLAAYFRMKYPHIVAGALASSAPILQIKTPCNSFTRIVTQDFQRESSECVETIRSSWRAIDRLSMLPGGHEELTRLFQLCQPLRSAGELKNWLTDMYMNLAMADYPYATTFLSDLPAYPIRVVCSNITSASIRPIDSDRSLVERIVKGANVFFNYTGQTPCFNTGSQGTPSIGALGWFYQSCTEFVMPICSNGIDDMFEVEVWDFQAWSEYCFTQWHVRPRTEWPLIEFGGKDLSNLRFYSNIIFTNGNLDPWSSGGVNRTITSSIPSILIDGGAHHLDLRAANKDDPSSVIAAREQIVSFIQRWIS